MPQGNGHSAPPAESSTEQADRQRKGGGGLFGNNVAIVAAALLFLTILVSLILLLTRADRSPVAGFAAVESRLLLPDLKSHLQDAELVRLEGRGTGLSFEKDGGEWRLLERSGYSVRGEAVQTLLAKLGDLRGLYVSTGDNPSYENYGVAPLDLASSRAVRVTVLNAEKDALARILVGHSFSAPGGNSLAKVFVRPDGDSRVWLADGNFEINLRPLEWLRQDLVNIPPDQVHEAATIGNGGERIVIRRGQTDDFHLAEGRPEDGEMAQSAVIDAIAGAFEDIRFTDVRPAEEILRDGRPAGRAMVTTANGVAYEIQFINDADQFWAVFSSETRNEMTDQNDPGQPSNAPDSAHRRAEAFNARHDGWAYLLPPSVVGALRTRPGELTKNK